MSQGVKGSKPKCSIDGCESVMHGNGLCNLHYKRQKIHGNPLTRLIRETGDGTPHIDGYWVITVDGCPKLRHVVAAEKALGKPLPKGAVVHHVDEDRSNDANDNLVICPDRGYHKILHMRMNALKECGNANWKRCWICKKHDSIENLKAHGSAHFHAECRTKYARVRYLARKAEADNAHV